MLEALRSHRYSSESRRLMIRSRTPRAMQGRRFRRLGTLVRWPVGLGAMAPASRSRQRWDRCHFRGIDQLGESDETHYARRRHSRGSQSSGTHKMSVSVSMTMSKMTGRSILPGESRSWGVASAGDGVVRTGSDLPHRIDGKRSRTPCACILREYLLPAPSSLLARNWQMPLWSSCTWVTASRLPGPQSLRQIFPSARDKTLWHAVQYVQHPDTGISRVPFRFSVSSPSYPSSRC